MGVDLFDALGGSVKLGVWTLPAFQSRQSRHHLSGVSYVDQWLWMFERFRSPTIQSSFRPVRSTFYHQPLALRQPISDELRRMECDGIIERIDASIWTSNIVVARKKNGEIRICVNLSHFNRALIPERYPLATMEELTERIAGSTCRTLQARLSIWGNLQLELAKECRYITAFVSHEGVFQFCSLPFMLANGLYSCVYTFENVLNLKSSSIIEAKDQSWKTSVSDRMTLLYIIVFLTLICDCNFQPIYDMLMQSFIWISMT